MKFVQTNRIVCVFFMHPRILGIMFLGCLSVCASMLAYIRTAVDVCLRKKAKALPFTSGNFQSWKNLGFLKVFETLFKLSVL